MKQTLSDPGVAWQSSENGYLWSLDGPLISRPHQAAGSSPAADVSWQCLSAASGTRAFAGVAPGPELVAMPWVPAQPARALQAHACAPPGRTAAGAAGGCNCSRENAHRTVVLAELQIYILMTAV